MRICNKYQILLAHICTVKLVFCLFVFIAYVPVNNNGHYWTVSSPNHTFSWASLGKLEQGVNQYFVHILSLVTENSKTCVKWPLSKRPKIIFKINYRLMQIKSIAECSKGAFCNTFNFIKLPFVIKIFVMSIFEWSFYTRFTVNGYKRNSILTRYFPSVDIAKQRI